MEISVFICNSRNRIIFDILGYEGYTTKSFFVVSTTGPPEAIVRPNIEQIVDSVVKSTEIYDGSKLSTETILNWTKFISVGGNIEE